MAQSQFSHLVSSAPEVRDALTSHPPTRFWWRIILMLHGKPVAPSLTPQERIDCISNGFHFYAWLYRVLGVIFAGVAMAFAALGNIDTSTSYTYWIGASGVTASYLWVVSGLGYAGARAYRQGQRDGAMCLMAFMVMIVAFLSLLVAALSVVVHQSNESATLPNLITAAVLFILGIGSYFIEIFYLLSDSSR